MASRHRSRNSGQDQRRERRQDRENRNQGGRTSEVRPDSETSSWGSEYLDDSIRGWENTSENGFDERVFPDVYGQRRPDDFDDDNFGELSGQDWAGRFDSARSRSDFERRNQGFAGQQSRENRNGDARQFRADQNRDNGNDRQIGSRWGQHYNQSRQSESSGNHVGKGPKGYRRSDERITEDINEQLMRDGDIDASEIEVQVQDGEVTLTGTADTRQAKRLAEDIAEGISGVQEVLNQIRVRREEQPPETGTRQGRKGRQSSGGKADI